MVDRLAGYDTSTGRKVFVGPRNVHLGKGIVSGVITGNAISFAISVSGLVVAAGEGKDLPISDGAFGLALSDATNPRVDIAQVSTGGELSMKAGTAAADPAVPEPDADHAFLAAIWVPANSSGLVRDMNGQLAITEAVIIEYYYMNGGVHASRVGVTADPSTTSNTFVDAEEMQLPVYLPDLGVPYEVCFDTVIQEVYGVLREGAVIGLEIDGSDLTEAIFARSSSFELLNAEDIFKYVYFLSVHHNPPLPSAGPHRIFGRWHKDSAGTSIEMKDQQRRIWIYQVAQPEA